MKNNMKKSIGFLKSVNQNTFWIMAVSNIFKAVFPFINIYLLYKLIDLLTQFADNKSIVLHIILLTSLNAVFTIFNKSFAQYLWSNINNSVFLAEKSAIIHKLMHVDYQYLENEKFVDLVKKYSDDQNNSGSVFISLLYIFSNIIAGTFSIAISAVMVFPFIKSILFMERHTGNTAFHYQIYLLLALVAGIILITVISSICNRKNFNLQMAFLTENRLFSFYSQFCADYKSGKDIRIYQCEPLILNHATNELIKNGVKINRSIGNYRAMNGAFNALIGSLIGCVLYIFIGLSAWKGLFSVALLVKYTGAFLQILEGFKGISASIGVMNFVKPKLKLFFEIMEYPVRQKEKSLPIPEKIESISFEHVTYTYENGENKALDDVSLQINGGETIAFVGENGSGKTTFIKLLCGLYDSYEGEIKVNQVNIDAFDPEQYNHIFTVTLQDFSVFSLPLGENIAFSENYDIGKMESCLEQVGMLSKVQNMKYGLGTYLYHDCNEEGIEISGGEAQKIALARCLYKNAEILILDEPTSALDPIAEANIYKKFNEYIKTNKKTAFLISHRLSSCVFCDKIAVFEKGKITQFGTHSDLVKDKNSKYYELWRSQAQYYT